MDMPKPSDDDKEAFRAFVPDDARVEVKPLFGNLGAFVNGNMFMGLFGSAVGLKLDGSERDQLLAVDGAGPYGPEERPMGGWVTMPARWRASAEEAAPWIDRALRHVGSLPPKVPKPKKAPRP